MSMSLLWNWGSRTLLRRQPHTAIGVAFPGSLASSTATTAAPASLSMPMSMSPFSMPGWTTTMALRFKSGVKTNSGCKKRFRVRGSGSIKRPKAGKSHNTGYLRRQRANRLGHSTGIEGKKIEQRVRK
eukprot:jgi/Psemu1/306296/fgenesh1_kg.247_\